ncbi:Asp-tRNA(Asn)/Glu-tRNA(Gln) amidotransferase A subunit family amidase [Streptomyces sp. SAI-195]|uniref:hypothetical protein n=1 Tax=Streptomyces sp. SAI-195 TaxID=3377734 RepID=UPI003C7BB8FB
MARSALTLTAATFAATAALLLTACGGEDSSPDDIKGAETEASSSSPSASASGAADVKRPDVSLPKDLKLVFDFDRPSDAGQAAALEDAANYIRALNHGITEQDAKDPCVRLLFGGRCRPVRRVADPGVRGRRLDPDG